jgi:hypothetical protein
MCQVRFVFVNLFDIHLRIIILGDWVYLHHAASTPVDLVNSLVRHAKKAQLKNIRTSHALLLGDIPFGQDESVYGKFKIITKA